MENKDLEYRMYGLVPYSLSPIQQAIQYGHGVVEYINAYIHRVYADIRDPLEKWMDEDKTFIILNGGTTNENPDSLGTLNKHCNTLEENGVVFSTFHEPDLGDQLTSVNFLVDERVWDREKYPDRFLGGSPTSGNMTLGVYYTPESEESYIRRIGGEKNAFLREFLKQFRLA